jgi:hypothetical protein
MKSVLSFLFILLCFVTTQSFQCGRSPIDRCDNYKTDTLLLNTTIVNAALEYHLYDTVWISSAVNDNFSPLSGSPASFNRPIEQMSLTIVPYAINTTGALPVMQYAYIEFNPVVREGSLQNPGYFGYNYNFRRVAPNNTLQAGLVAGRTGLYIIDLAHGTYYGGGSFQVNNGNDYCTTYFGQSAVPVSQQNRSYWSTLGVSSISLAPNYGAKTISLGSRNYFIFRVIP